MKLPHLVIGIVAIVPFVSGCLQSDAARMEEMRKYAGAGVSDSDDEETTVTQKPATNYVPPTRNKEEAPAKPVAAAVAASAPATSPTTSPVTAPTPPASANAAASTQTAVPTGVSDTLSPPPTPLSLVERRQMTIDNIKRIAAAFEAYRENEKRGGSYPAQYLSDPGGQPLLSWRVQLLPYLGYADLYNQFHHNERWDSTHNQSLIPKIPAVYQSPERFDVYTNYLVPVSGGAAFDGANPKPIRRWEDGLENSIILAEVDDDHSVIWTEPRDWPFDPRTPRQGLGNLRDDGFFAIWGGGEISLVPKNGGSVRNAFTVDGGDVTVASLKKPAFASQGGIADAFQRNSDAPSMTSVASGSNAASESRADGNFTPSSGQTHPDFIAGTSRFDAQAAFHEGRESDAIEMFYADALAGNAAAFQHYRWIPALSRPAAIVRYGIGIDYTGTGAKAAKHAAIAATSVTTSTGRSGHGRPNEVQRLYEKLTGRFGQEILHTLQAQPLHCPFEIIQQDPQPRRRDDDEVTLDQPAVSRTRIVPGIQFVGVDSPRRLLAAAEKNQVDILVFFQINRRNRSKDVRVSLVDAMRRKTVLNTNKLNSREVEVAKADLLEDDPTLDVLDQVADFVGQELTPAPLPPGLKTAAARKRVASLREIKSNPLRVLAEVQLYRQLGLIDLRLQSEVISSVLDEDAALVLIGGSPDEILSTLEPLLPRERAAENAENWRQNTRSRAL